ncbi:MAG: hypothetical protein KAX49_17990 [Halanaerobiales bacterium]|nr:hypothetical protein [Halanaerobiales bacterium]
MDISGDVYQEGETVSLNGYTLNIFGGSYYLSNGTLNLGGGNLNIAAEFFHTGGFLQVNSGELHVVGSYLIEQMVGELRKVILK